MPGVTTQSISAALRDAYLPFIVARANGEEVPSGLVWRVPGATKFRRRDGSTYILKRWRTANVAYGNGNKVKRRMGLIAVYDDRDQAWDWVPADTPVRMVPHMLNGPKSRR